MRLARILLVVAAVAGFHRTSPAQAVAPRWAPAVDSVVRAEMARARVPGVQIAVVANGRLAYSKGYGVADVESGRAVTERTLFQIGSVTKAVTGALLAQLAAEGTVDLHAPVSRYVPEIAGRRVGAVTTHQLLSQTAGWADWLRAFGTTDESALGRVFSDVGDTLVLTEPGRLYSYSNPSLAMAGYVAERATKTPYVDLAERVVLRKLGMPRATFRSLTAMTHDFSLGHVPGPGGAPVVQRPMPNNAAEYPSGFLWASAAELARLEMALMANGMLDGARVLSADAVRAMTTGTLRIPGSPRNWSGYGLQVDTLAGQRVWRKTGNVTGFNAEISMWPDLQVAVVTLTNRVTAAVRSENVAVRVNVLAAQIVSGRSLERETTAAARPPTDEERRQLVGRYRTGTESTLGEVAEVNGGLEWRAARTSFPLRLVSADRALGERAGQPPIEIIVVRDADGRVIALHNNARAYVKQP